MRLARRLDLDRIQVTGLASNVCGKSIVVDSAEEWRAFHRLPVPVREALRKSWFNWECSSISERMTDLKRAGLDDAESSELTVIFIQKRDERRSRTYPIIPVKKTGA